MTIALWAALKAGVAEDLGARPVMTTAQRDTIRLHAAPPAASRVHLAHYTGKLGPILYQRILGQAPAGHPLAGSMAGSSVMVIGALVALVYLAPRDAYNAVIGQVEMRPNWVSCWPPISPSATWPPYESVDERGALELLVDAMPGSGVDVDHLLGAWTV